MDSKTKSFLDDLRMKFNSYQEVATNMIEEAKENGDELTESTLRQAKRNRSRATVEVLRSLKNVGLITELEKIEQAGLFNVEI